MKQNKNDIQITSLQDAQAAIHLVKKRVKLREQDLSLRLERLPLEGFKATTGLFLPAFINNKINEGTWELVKDGFSLVNPFSKNKKESMKDAAKHLGLMWAMKAVQKLVKKKDEK